MKLKIFLATLFVAGVGASLAFADGSPKPKDSAPACQEVHLQGTIAPQSLAMTVNHSGENNSVAPGTQVTLQVGATGQTVNVNVEACASGSTYVVKSLELHPAKPHHDDENGTTTTTSTTKGDDDSGEHHGDKGGTTTTATTTTATTTSTTP